MARKKHHQQTIIVSISKAAERLEIEPRRLRYLIRKHHLEPVPRLNDGDKRCTFYMFSDLLSIATR